MTGRTKTLFGCSRYMLNSLEAILQFVISIAASQLKKLVESGVSIMIHHIQNVFS